ncbi:MAG: imidazole glycerol phosphate synthase subunit HisH [Thermomicrobiales bacterium]|nr:MAG: imidazole glycerol phosphate synthase subunit HisH [Thermomicrobiales bacterium]
MTSRPRVAVIDHGAGNLVSIDQALTTVGADGIVVADRGSLTSCDAMILPGVGAAGPAMARLKARGLADPIRAWAAAERPLLGICLGLQLLFDVSDEDGAETLGIVPGRTVRMEHAPTLPHTGWNQVEQKRSHPIFDGIVDGADLYFVHSYVGRPAASAQDVVLATTEHGAPFVSALARGSLLGVQFHPERSGRDGLRLLANFVDLVRAA